MSMTKDMWMDEVESITSQFCDEEITLNEAIRELERLGFGTQEARDLLDGATA